MNETLSGIALEDVRFRYPDMEMHFDIAIPPNAITAVMGPSGSGKSTLLDFIAGFRAPESGRVLIGGADVTGLPPDRRPVSMVFQENNLFAHLDVAKNVGLGRSPSLKLSAADHEAVADALRRTGLTGKERRLPRELSGGERQRVAIARVLVRNRPVLLMDEPFAALGPALREDMMELIATLQAERELTVVLVTHHPEDARRVASHIAFVENGTVAASGPAADFFAPDGPEAFRRYVGEAVSAGDLPRFARKPT
ncbi:thiamine ABC transporter ATP-binding protein [Mesorhizobium sp. LHD-90]|uniref:thiamine ABC transporter ATP-binding protein n=1 Tax=Mesorhizobium sp. LHD-90 TaxID=3071414 RepID=UPI0027E209C5|nr:thiamine ABC transporter ATP-binding protein [Mesorhizobium sp. LHD-90]MDQ6437035.1 thiamine ABC transporter ATP-binding protein [Mesorhizobium sp. LHD-90]